MSRAGARLEQLRDRNGFVEPKEARPLTIVIRAPSQTEWWVRVSGDYFELERAITEASAMNPVVLERK